MRFFSGVCLICGLIASVGCMTNNWSSPLFSNPFHRQTENADRPGFFHQTFGEPSGIDRRAQDIEKSLGVGYDPSQ